MAPIDEELILHEPPAMMLGPLEAALGADEAGAEALLRELAAGDGTANASAEIERKAFSDCKYVSCKPLGLSMRLKPPDASGRVDVVFLYNEGADGFSAYTASPLPAGLRWSDRSRDVVKKLGEPSDKFGGNRLPVGIGYELLGLDVHFNNRSWDDAVNPIKFLSVYQQVDQACGMCTACGRQARFRCAQCRQESYCSSACQRADWGRHKEACASAADARLRAGLALGKEEAMRALAGSVSADAIATGGAPAPAAVAAVALETAARKARECSAKAVAPMALAAPASALDAMD